MCCVRVCVCACVREREREGDGCMDAVGKSGGRDVVESGVK